jgi:hypothetical protein
MNERMGRRHMLRGLARLLVSVAAPDPGGLLSGMADEDTAPPVAAPTQNSPHAPANGDTAFALPEAKALLAEAQRAAETVSEPGERVSALASVAAACLRAGEPARAKAALIAARQTLVRAGEGSHPSARRDLIEAMAAAGDLAGARTLARTITESPHQAAALASLAVAEARAGDFLAAAAIVERLAAGNTPGAENAVALTMAYRGIAAAHLNRGDLALGRVSLNALRTAAAKIPSAEDRAHWEREVVALLGPHDASTARSIADGIRDPAERVRAMASLAEARSDATYREGSGRGAAEAALSAAEQIKDGGAGHVFALARVIGALARTGGAERARQMVESTTALIRRLPDATTRAEAYTALTRAAAPLPHAETLFTLARQESERIADPAERATAFVELISASRQAEMPASLAALVPEAARHARRAAESLPALTDRAYALVALAEALSVG